MTGTRLDFPGPENAKRLGIRVKLPVSTERGLDYRTNARNATPTELTMEHGGVGIRHRLAFAGVGLLTLAAFALVVRLGWQDALGHRGFGKALIYALGAIFVLPFMGRRPTVIDLNSEHLSVRGPGADRKGGLVLPTSGIRSFRAVDGGLRSDLPGKQAFLQILDSSGSPKDLARFSDVAVPEEIAAIANAYLQQIERPS